MDVPRRHHAMTSSSLRSAPHHGLEEPWAPVRDRFRRAGLPSFVEVESSALSTACSTASLFSTDRWDASGPEGRVSASDFAFRALASHASMRLATMTKSTIVQSARIIMGLASEMVDTIKSSRFMFFYFPSRLCPFSTNPHDWHRKTGHVTAHGMPDSTAAHSPMCSFFFSPFPAAPGRGPSTSSRAGGPLSPGVGRRRTRPADGPAPVRRPSGNGTPRRRDAPWMRGARIRRDGRHGQEGQQV